jgi:hypothetical protein
MGRIGPVLTLAFVPGHCTATLRMSNQRLILIGMKRGPTANGPGAGCRRKRNGKKQPAEKMEGAIPGGMKTQIAAWRIILAAAARSYRWAVFRMGPVLTVRWIWTGTSGNKWRIGMMKTITANRRKRILLT